MSDNSKPWLAKLAAWTHDPAEKALVLLRDPAGHEGGTVRELRQRLFPDGLPSDISEAVKRGDHWASAADRPQFGSGGRNAWAQVRFNQQPVLIHPLSGEEYDLGKLADIDPAHIKAVSQTHFDGLVVNGDAKKTALNFWRFGPDIDADIRTLWRLLPADTRVPDHTIWAHLDLTAAFATAFTADTHGNAALLAMSFGPVQDFIAAARTTSDLWAGSHLLSRLAWEGLKIIADEIGPDAVIFPQLRGVPQVDLWLQNEIGLPGDRFANCDWATEKTDANPLFGAALPNKFVAIVPAGRAEELARKVTEAVRNWVLKNAQTMLAELLDKSGLGNDPTLPCHAQLAEQLAGFPEVHWASVPFGLIATDSEGKADKDQPALVAASQPFFGKVEKPGFLGSKVWQVLAKEIEVEGAWFFIPNPGVLYPAIYDLLDRVAASAKSIRPFVQTKYEGYRCDLTGEAEWLTTDRTQLAYGKQGRKDAPTLWNKATKAFPGLFRKGEHLSALAMLKRMWPRTFAQEIAATLDIKVQRYVVSTHTMALATSMERWIEDGGLSDNRVGEFERLIAEASTAPPTALPRRLIRKLYVREAVNSQTRDLAARLPGLLDQDELPEDRARALDRDIAKLLGAKPEAYYAFILLDGDRMGAWLSGTEPDYLLTYGDTWHPKIRHTAAQKFPQLAPYLASTRAVSPARHMAISAALNDFALTMARHVVEDLCKGKLIYAGGDDVLAMVSVDDLLRCLTLLRLAYSGVWPEQEGLADLLKLGNERGMSKLKRGHAMLDGQLLRLMGEKATASAGAIVAHHQTPLSRVLRELRATEKRAKTQGGRDAFSINLLKRSGGAVHLTLPWIVPGETWPDALKGSLTNTPMALLIKLRDSFVGNTSRRAAYLTQGWLEDLPTASQIDSETLKNLLSANLKHQLKRQGGDSAGALGPLLAEIACAVGRDRGADPRDSLKSPEAALIRDMLAVAEFLAREGRTEYREKI
ncbi:MAG: type III-B CRISPR-associated protein Cas10/Cmr2 [Betaproteobacteria bacterium]